MKRIEIDSSAWQELSELLDEALDRPISERERWIESLAARFDALKPQLRQLLVGTGSVETRDFLNTLPDLDLGPEDLAPLAPRGDQTGDVIGAYRLMRALGSGGMGAVWLAERVDGLVNRPVALKLPHGAWKRAGLAERMAREREILATLNHPNIARLYDAGLAADGQPFLAIEYVEGRRIDVYCRDAKLDPKARLKLFAQTAQAVAYAHSKLVVHRDLKPANILVGADGQVRLLDFGIAKLIEEGQAQETRLTELSGRALTPDYASPEQILGAPLTIASDVYSLGVILYELLSGRRPYKLKRDSRGALEDAILQVDPAPPSEVADQPWSKLLRGDLDTIVLKSLKKDPAERYPTVHALLDDIERYLAARPVLAQPDSRWYRTRKFIARNRLAVGAGAAILLTIVIGAGAAVWQARLAVAEKRRAEEVKEFIASFFRDADPYVSGGKPLTAIELLKLGRQRMDEELSAHPKVRVELLRIIGESALALQDNETAESALLQALHEAQGSFPVDDPSIVQAELLLAEAQGFLSKTDEARRRVHAVLALLEKSGRLETEQFVIAKVHEAHLALDEANIDVAEKAVSQAIGTALRVLPADSPVTVQAFDAQTTVYRLQGKSELALTAMRKVYEMKRQIYHDNALHPKIIDARMGYGLALAGVGQTAAAVQNMRTSLTNAVAVFGPDAMMVGYFSGHLARVQIGYGQIEEAIANARTAVRILVGDGSKRSVPSANRLRTLGDALLAARRPREASTHLLGAIGMGEKGAARDGLLASRTSNALALIYLGRLAEAEVLLEQVIEERRADPSRLIHEPLTYLGILRRLQSRNDSALQLFEQALAAVRSEPHNEVALAQVLVEQGLAHVEMGEHESAVQPLERAHSLLTRVQVQPTPLHADALVGLGRAAMEQSPTEARVLLEKADAFWRAFDAENRWAGEAALWLGRCYLVLGRPAEAHVALGRAEKILARSPIPADGRLVKLARER